MICRMHLFVSVSFILCCVVLLHTERGIGADNVSLEDNKITSCINKWRKNIDSLKLIKFSSAFVDWIEYKDGTRTEDNPLQMDWVIDFTSKRFWKGTIERDEVTDGEKYEFEHLDTGNNMLMASKYADEGEEVEKSVLSYVDNDNNVIKGKMGLLYWSFPFGFIEEEDKNIFLSDVFRSATWKISNENGRQVFYGTDRNFTITLEFDSEECHFIKYLEMKRMARADSPFIFQECKYVVNRAEEYNGIYLPIDYYVEGKYNGGKQPVVNLPPGVVAEENMDMLSNVTDMLPHTMKANVTLTNIEIPDQLSESDFQIKMTIPDYTPVYMQDALHIDHIWRDGKAVPLTDELALERARGHGFMPGPDEPRFWLMGIGIGLILFACGKKTYDYFKNRKDK